MFEPILKKLLNRKPTAYKYDFGHVLVVGGSPGMVGAPLIAGKAALRIGAGLVTVASESAVIEKLERRVEEIMTLRLENVRKTHDFIEERKVNSLIIGPGLKGSEDLIFGLMRSNLPIVIDGGALAALANKRNNLQKILNESSKNLILTPHLGEFQRFFEEKLPERKDQLKRVAQSFAKRNNLILVLKGHPTYVASPQGSIYVNQTGDPGLATAGTGDVLAGMLGGLIAQGIKPFEAAKLGVYLHGLAGDIATKQKTEAGVIAGDVIESIPEALKQAA